MLADHAPIVRVDGLDLKQVVHPLDRDPPDDGDQPGVDGEDSSNDGGDVDVVSEISVEGGIHVLI